MSLFNINQRIEGFLKHYQVGIGVQGLESDSTRTKELFLKIQEFIQNKDISIVIELNKF